MKAILNALCAIFAGAAAGIGVNVVFGASAPAAQAPVEKVRIVERIRATEPAEARDQAPLPAASEAPPARQATNVIPQTDEARERSYEQLRTLFQSRLGQHAVEPVDPNWAPNSSRALREGFAKAQHDLPYKVVSVDCRSKQCRVDLEWPSLRDAKGALLETGDVEGDIGDCARHLVLNKEASEPFRSTVLYDCREAAQ
jgi:hypothetical protein